MLDTLDMPFRGGRRGEERGEGSRVEGRGGAISSNIWKVTKVKCLFFEEVKKKF